MTTKPQEGFQRLDDLIEFEILKSRKLFFCKEVSSTSAKEAIEKLWFLEAQDPKKPITLVINSPGGSIDAGFAIWDQAKMIKCPIYTLVTGLAASMGSILSLAADKGKRFATPNCRIMIHQPSIHGVIQGQATDLEIQANEIIKTRKKLIDLYIEKTGKSAEYISKALDRDCWMSAQEAKKEGFIDKIVTDYSQIK